jgi:O-antigen/teichoic acid export membrane protein
MGYTTLKKAAASIALSSVMLLVPGSALAVSIVPECARGSDVPQLDCVLETAGNIAQLILGLTGGLALLMFVYGGFLMLSSGGNSERVGQGKKVLAAAVVGIVIVLMAGYLVRFGLSRLGVEEEYLEVPASAGTTTDSGSGTTTGSGS